MSRIHSAFAFGSIRPIFAAIRTVPVPVKPGEPGAQPESHAPFITISREAGAGGRSLAEGLVSRLNSVDSGEQPWTCWDRELVEKVAQDGHISQTLVESLGESGRTWMQDFLAALAFVGPDETEARVYQGVATTIRALAQVGRVVIVGRGSVFVTHNMPGGIHIRLVAPVEWRIEHMAQQMNLTRAVAAAQVHQLDHNRAAFYHRYWPGKTLAPELFTLVLNTALLNEQQLLDSVIPLIPIAVRQQTNIEH